MEPEILLNTCGRMNTQLVCYAPGDGALSFTYVEELFNRDSGCFESIAIDKSVTREVVEERAKARHPDYLIIEMGETTIQQRTIQVEVPPKRKRGRPRKNPKMEPQVITVEIPPQYRLCAPVFRVGPNSVRLGDTVYKYSVNKDHFRGEYTNFNTLITWHWYIDNDEKVLADEEDREVRNVNTCGAILWFLNHEKRIVQQYPKQDETTAATVDQLREEVQNLQRAGMSDEDIRDLMNEDGIPQTD